MMVGGEIPSRGNGAKEQSKACGVGWDSWCMWVGEPGKQVGVRL